MLSAVSHADLRRLSVRSDAPGLRRLAIHGALLGLAAAGVLVAGERIWSVPSMALLGVIEVALFTPLHETTHGTPFRSTALNRIVGVVAGFVLILPPTRFRYFHMAHHRHAQDPASDPELMGMPPLTRASYWLRLSGVPYWTGQCRALFATAGGRANESWIPLAGRMRVVREARCYLGAYALLAGMALAAHSTLPLVLWVVPVLLGQPVLRVVLMAEHATCPLGGDSYANTRTTLTSAPVRLLFWNANYHAEHHLRKL